MIRVDDKLILQAVRIVEERSVVPFAIFWTIARRIFDFTQSLFLERYQDLFVKLIDIISISSTKCDMMIMTDCSSNVWNGRPLRVCLADAYFVGSVQIPPLPVFVCIVLVIA